jgi:predicted metal-dependent phosphotriesterase family hydrolase
MTVLGPVPLAEVGITAAHEHLLARSTSNRLDPDTELDEMDTAVEELAAFRQAGGDTIVEVTTIDMGRDIHRLVELSTATGVKIIAATGFYKGNYSGGGEKTLPAWDFLPPALRQASVSHLADLFIQEVQAGVAGTTIKVGIIGEIGTSFNEILPDEAKVFRAAARASRLTGVPISTHATLGTMGREQIVLLREEGADLRHVVLGHLDLATGPDYHLELAQQGVFLGFDTAGKEQYRSDAARVELIRRMVKAGFEDQIVLSCDIGRRSLMHRYGGRGYAYLLTKFVPELRAAGIDQTTIEKFLIHNPRRLLDFSTPGVDSVNQTRTRPAARGSSRYDQNKR